MGKKILILISLGMIISACSNSMKQKLGIVTTGPNEYKVQTNRPLDVPPHYDIPVPAPVKQQNIDKTTKNS